eukprot:TRINITY_DN10782_c0_g1_i3.p3 TRINITY_DN10782_c0_g1~~TRINITY_DN10782_c0_g1_i3.p3  ORF type:complete len:188 (-),score=-14.77 TRINITY_DN10782_c0_g1_i3:352-915(-)
MSIVQGKMEDAFISFVFHKRIVSSLYKQIRYVRIYSFYAKNLCQINQIKLDIKQIKTFAFQINFQNYCNILLFSMQNFSTFISKDMITTLQCQFQLDIIIKLVLIMYGGRFFTYFFLNKGNTTINTPNRFGISKQNYLYVCVCSVCLVLAYLTNHPNQSIVIANRFNEFFLNFKAEFNFQKYSYNQH